MTKTTATTTAAGNTWGRNDALVWVTPKRLANDVYADVQLTRADLEAMLACVNQPAWRARQHRHRHVQAHDGTDRCDACNLDLRNIIHLREAP